MSYSRLPIKDLENYIRKGGKKFVRAKEGAQLYSMGLHSFQELGRDAGAVYHIKKICLYNTDVIDEYMEAFRDDMDL